MTSPIAVRESTTIIRLLDWTYRRQKADVMVGKGLHGAEAGADGEDGGVFARGTSSAAAVAMSGQLGCIIRSTGWQQAPDVHPDAVVVVEAADTMGFIWSRSRRGALAENGGHI